jgi:hypothetical protein
MEETGEIESKKWRIKDTDSKEFWLPLLKQKTFNDYVKSQYQVASGEILKNEDFDIDEVDSGDDE